MTRSNHPARMLLALGWVLLVHARPQEGVQHRIVSRGPGDPLFLTPFVESGRKTLARDLARVGPLSGDGMVTSYSGYLTVNKEYNSNLFFWFFPAQKNPREAPVILWLQGGPGGSSMYGLFAEHGPFYVDRGTSRLKQRKYSWAISHSMLYIDNPVGTGFSFTENDLGYSKNQTDVGRNLYIALLQFFQLFPQFQMNDFFISGESYAGKYVPAIAYKIHQENPNAALKINLKGLAIGNGLYDPEHMMKYSSYLYQLGLIDSHARELMKRKEDEVVRHIQENNFHEANIAFDELLNGDYTSDGSIFFKASGFKLYYNFLRDDMDTRMSLISEYLERDYVRKAIHVGSKRFNSVKKKIVDNLFEDVMKSVKPWVESLLDSGMYKILFYSGQMDIIVAYPLTLSFLDSLNWSGANSYARANRTIWRVDGEIAGFSKAAGPLAEVLVRNAGHMVPADQPKWALDLIRRFTTDERFFM